MVLLKEKEKKNRREETFGPPCRIANAFVSFILDL